ncbi:MAG TPA: hypothetical protein DCW31_08980 [Lactobacillus sp.]|nr:hypothetical protein [Lactobacillus sp.]
MRLRNYIYILIIGLVAVGVSALTVKPVADTRQQAVSQTSSSNSSQSDSTKSSSKKAAKQSTKDKTKTTSKKVSTETVSDYTLTKTATTLPEGLASGQAPTGWSTPISLTLSSAALNGTSEQNLVRFDGLSVGSKYRLWIVPTSDSTSTKGYKVDYRPTSSSQYVPTRLLRTVLNEAQKSDASVSQLAIYNVRENE